ncbi:MAG TPA: outer membrane beta-barrel family protein [Chitinophagaceae bacterium]|nr:outer membrane beta-barrel family protein [Chitinophagaceae bacterium]
MKYFSVFILLFITWTSNAQKAKIQGVVKNAGTKSPIELATITLKNLNDTSKLLGAKTGADGTFSINDIPYGKYKIQVSCLQFKPKVFESITLASANKSLGDILLESGTSELKSVQVSGERQGIEVGIDKKTFYADKNITSAGGVALDLLKNIPSVNVDMDGNVSIRGKDNVTLLVDGKPSSIFGNDPQTALNTIPASSIESIEVITNPSSKYEAQGMSGILNIILKKDRKSGYNAMLNLGTGIPYKLNGGINLNANVRKWNFFLNANTRTSRTWEESTTERKNYTDLNTYSSFEHNDRRPLSGFINLGGEYNLNKNNKITLSENIFNAKMKGDKSSETENEINFSTLQSALTRTNNYMGNPLSSTTNLQYKHNFTRPKEELNTELNFSKTRYRRTSTFETRLFDSNHLETTHYLQENPILGGNWNGTFQIDYTRPVGKNGRIDLGEKTYYIRFESENQPTIQYAGQAAVEESILKNHFKYTQQVHGVYANVANQYGATGVQVGLRGEYFSYDGFAYQYNAGVNNYYLGLFPTLFVTHKLSPKEDLNFNYSRRVNRPGFMQLIPYLDVSNPQDTSMGNPALKPEFIHATELTYSLQYGKSNTLIASAYYQFTQNLIQRYRRFNADGTTFSQNRNLASGMTYGLEITNKANLLKWWDATVNVNVFRNQLDGANLDATLKRAGWGGFAKLTSNMKLQYGFNAQLTANYNARTVISQGYIEPYGNIDIAIKKSFYKGLLNLTLNTNDLLNTIQTNTIYEQAPYYYQTVLRKNQTRSVGLNLQIRLASKSQRQNPEPPRKMSPTKEGKEKEGKSRDENLKKEDGGGDDNPGGGQNKENK